MLSPYLNLIIQKDDNAIILLALNLLVPFSETITGKYLLYGVFSFQGSYESSQKVLS